MSNFGIEDPSAELSIISAYETDRAFADESPRQTLGRLDLLQARTRGEAIVHFWRQGFKPQEIVSFLNFLAMHQNQVDDFVINGLGQLTGEEDLDDEGLVSGGNHPATDVIDDSVENYVESANFSFADKLVKLIMQEEGLVMANEPSFGDQTRLAVVNALERAQEDSLKSVAGMSNGDLLMEIDAATRIS